MCSCGSLIPRIRTPWTQPHKTSHVPASAKSTRVVQGQNEGQRNQWSSPFHLFEHSHLRIYFLGDLLDPPVVFRNPFGQRFDFSQQRVQNIPQLLTSPLAISRFICSVPHFRSRSP